MDSHELAHILLGQPAMEVGTEDGTVVNAYLSSYDNKTGSHEYMHLDVEEDD